MKLCKHNCTAIISLDSRHVASLFPVELESPLGSMPGPLFQRPRLRKLKLQGFNVLEAANQTMPVQNCAIEDLYLIGCKVDEKAIEVIVRAPIALHSSSIELGRFLCLDVEHLYSSRELYLTRHVVSSLAKAQLHLKILEVRFMGIPDSDEEMKGTLNFSRLRQLDELCLHVYWTHSETRRTGFGRLTLWVSFQGC
jgi:hypothetical protein